MQDYFRCFLTFLDIRLGFHKKGLTDLKAFFEMENRLVHFHGVKINVERFYLYFNVSNNLIIFG